MFKGIGLLETQRRCVIPHCIFEASKKKEAPVIVFTRDPSRVRVGRYYEFVCPTLSEPTFRLGIIDAVYHRVGRAETVRELTPAEVHQYLERKRLAALAAEQETLPRPNFSGRPSRRYAASLHAG